MTNIKQDYFGYDLYHAMYSGNLFERIWHKTRVKKILNAFEYSGKKILEIGCNSGPVLIPLLQKGYDATGFDISKDDIKKAKEYASENNIKKTPLCVGNGHAIPFQNDTFDLALMIDLFEHTSNPQGIANESYRVLKKGGKALVAVPWGLHPVWNPSIKKIMSGRTNIDEAPDNFLSFKEIKNIFSKFQLEQISLKVYFAWIMAIFTK